MNFAKKELKIAQLNNLKKFFERVVLIKIIQKKIQIAQTQFEKKRKSTKKIKRKKKVLNALNSILYTKTKLKRHKMLLKWIEQQRREIVNDLVNIEKKTIKLDQKNRFENASKLSCNESIKVQ